MFKKSSFLERPGKNTKEKYLLLFVVSFLGMMICFIPSMIANKGIFLYYGDFNSQQMMFYKHAQEMVKDGNLGWDWGTDLGSSFMTSYSFYLLGSPFFWLTTLFPKGVAVYLIPWLLALKTSVAAMSAYAYIRYFVESKWACFMGGLLYAFSGFQTYNVFFNHFHDATAVFPLLLLSLELLVNKNKKGPFALAVALCATISYFFFISDCVFLVIYFFIRCTDKNFKITFKKFGLIILEGVIGVMISCFIFLPSCLQVLGNYRVKEKLYGLDMVVYGENTRIPRIIQAFFMLSDMPARINLFGQADKARWASLAGYLPMFSMAGVIAFIRTRKKQWETKAIAVFGIMACVPILNSAFVLFNASYYARWYYSPILIMCLMTAKVLDKDYDDLKKGFIPVTVIGLGFLAVGMLPTLDNEKPVYGKMAKYPELYYIQFFVTIIMITMLAVLIYVIANKKINYKKTAAGMTAVACVICMASSVYYGVAQGQDNSDYIKRAINGSDNINMEKLEKSSSNYNSSNSFYRIDTSPDVDNWCMFWNLSSMRCFHSVVSTSIMDFYTEIGQTRDVASRIDTRLYPLRSLFSVKYYFNENDNAGKIPTQTISGLEGFNYVDTQNGFDIYENENYIPMGFAYDNYISDEDMKKLTETEKTQALLKALVLTSDQAMKYKDYVSYGDFSSLDYDETSYKLDCQSRKSESCDSFSYNSYGFDATINLSSPKLVFFSVPYDKGWSAQVNGKDVSVEKVDYGFMAVPCQQGKNTIHFTYRTYGLTAGQILTVVGIGSFAAYLGVVAYCKKKRKSSVVLTENNNDEN